MKDLFKKLILMSILLIGLMGIFRPTLTLEARTSLGKAENYAECMEDWELNVRNGGTTPRADAERNCKIQFQSTIPLNADGSVKTNTDKSSCGALNMWQCFIDILLFAPGWIAQLILQLSTLIVWISGAVLNYAVNYSVVEMKEHLNAADSVNNAWRVIRDVANMGFIFVLLYASIKTIIGQGKDTKGLIVRIVVVAVLINFSLFFTKIVIDISNVLAMLFYNAIAPNAGIHLGINVGLADSLMKPLQMQSIFDSVSKYDGSKLFIVGVMGTIFCLIAAFVFFAIAIMFIIRFVVLMFVLVLSPIAFVAFILPDAGKYQRQWIDALIGQAFFAPIYFLLTWIVIAISGGVLKTTGSFAGALVGSEGEVGQAIAASPTDMGVLVNFMIMIALLITSLTIAKEWSGKAGSGVQSLTKWATGAAGDRAIGLTSWAGRTSIGRLGNMAAKNATLQEKADKGTAWARLGLYTAKKARSGTFDVRNATVPTNVIGETIEGTLGRTPLGKRMGLDEVNIPSVAVGNIANSNVGLGTAETTGFKENKEAKVKRLGEKSKARTEEYRAVTNEAKVVVGVKAAPGSTEYEEMEKTLAKMSDKEVEAIVEGNKQLLESLEFSKSISVKQLEALNKSDKFTETEKDAIKKQRFAAIESIDDAAGIVALAIPAALRTPIQTTAATRVETSRKAVASLADSELEMIDPTIFSKPEFISTLRPGQIESINKSSKFTKSQKAVIKTERLRPLLNALDTSGTAYAANPNLVKDMLTKKLNVKDVAGLMSTNATYVDYTGTPLTTPASILLHPEALGLYTPNMLKRMAQEMNTNDISMIRTTIEDASTNILTAAYLGTRPQILGNIRKLDTWLKSPDGSNFS